MSETIRDVTINVRLKMVDDKPLKAGVESVRAETAKLAPEHKKQADAVAAVNDRLKLSLQIEKEKLRIVHDQLSLESKKQTNVKAELDYQKQLLRLKEQQNKLDFEGGSKESAKAPEAPGRSAIGAVSDIGKIIGAVLSGPGIGAAILEHVSSTARGAIPDIKGKSAFTEGTFTKAGAEFYYTMDKLGKELRKYVFGTTYKPKDLDFASELGHYKGTAEKVRILPKEEVENSARQTLISTLERENSQRQQHIESTRSLIDSEYKLQHLEADRFRQSARALSGSTALERDTAMKLAIRIKLGGLDSLTREQREAAFSNPILAPKLEQLKDDQYRAGPTDAQKAFTAQIDSALGLKDRVDAANAATARDLKVDQKIAVNIGIQSLDKITQELTDKLLPELIKLNTSVIAQILQQMKLDEARRRNSGAPGGPASGGGF